MLAHKSAFGIALSCVMAAACGSSSSDDDDSAGHGGAAQGGSAGAASGRDPANGGASAGAASGGAGNSTGGARAGSGGGSSGGTMNGGGTAGVGASSGAGDDDGGATESGGASTGGTSTGGSASGMVGGGTGGSANGGMGGCASTGPAALLLLVDISLSMAQEVDGLTKMELTRAALDEMVDGLPDGFAVGLVFFPNVETDDSPVCFVPDTAVDIQPLNATQRGFLHQSLAAAEPRGGTPTHDAYAYALSALSGVGSGVRQNLLLITDGQPTYALGCCAGAPPDCAGTGLPTQIPETPTDVLVEAVLDAYADGVRTFVVGSPGSEPAREALSFMARYGGTGPSDCVNVGPNYCHYDMTQSANVTADLTAALADIATHATGSGCP